MGKMARRIIRKGAADAIKAFIEQQGGVFPAAVQQTVQEISRVGATPLVVAENKEVLGVIHLKDIVKGGIKERFAHLRKMGIKTVMITGDNPLQQLPLPLKPVSMIFLPKQNRKTN